MLPWLLPMLLGIVLLAFWSFILVFLFSNLGGSFTLNFNMNIILHSEIFPTFTFGYCLLINHTTSDTQPTQWSLCDKSWLSKADFTWLILISHKVCWVFHYDVIWLIAFTWLRTCESLGDYDWLMISWRHDRDVIWCNDFAYDYALASHGFHTCDSFERMIEFMGRDQGKRMCAVDS